MYCEHLLSIEHVQKLLCHQEESGPDERRTLSAPPFFISQNDKKVNKGDFFPSGSEAEHRIRSLPKVSLPLFLSLHPSTRCLLLPSWFLIAAEKIFLSLREIIHEEDPNQRVMETLLISPTMLVIFPTNVFATFRL
jgi:1,3-beta-glucan synthase